MSEAGVARIRPASPDDYAAIRQVAVVTWAATYAGLIAPHTQRAFLARAYSDRWLARRHQRPGGRLVVAEIERQLVGYASSLERTFDAAELTSLYVLPAYQGRGIGSALLRHELAALAVRGIEFLLASVLRENHPARRFYERHGFQMVDEQTGSVLDQRIVEVVYGRRVKE